MRILTLGFLLLFFLPTATAQDGCTEASPCEWQVDVDAEGFDALGEEFLENEATAGDWWRIGVYNLDDKPHSLLLTNYDLTWTVPSSFADEAPEDGVTWSPVFQLTLTGVHDLVDETAGDTALFSVFDEDIIDLGNDDDNGGKGTPMVSPLLVGIALLALAARRR